MIATGGTIITATDVMIAAVTEGDPQRAFTTRRPVAIEPSAEIVAWPGVSNPATWRMFDTVFADDEEHVEGKLTFPRAQPSPDSGYT